MFVCRVRRGGMKRGAKSRPTTPTPPTCHGHLTAEAPSRRGTPWRRGAPAQTARRRNLVDDSRCLLCCCVRASCVRTRLISSRGRCFAPQHNTPHEAPRRYHRAARARLRRPSGRRPRPARVLHPRVSAWPEAQPAVRRVAAPGAGMRRGPARVLRRQVLLLALWPLPAVQVVQLL